MMASSGSAIVSFQSDNVNDFISQGTVGSIFTRSALLLTPSSPTPTESAARFIWNGFTCLLFQAFQRAISFADNFLSSWALVIFGFGFGEGDGEAVASWAKLMVAKASTHSAAKGR